MSKLPLIGKQGGEFSDRDRGQVDEQLCEVELRIHVMTSASTCQASQDCRGSSTAWVADEARDLAIKNHAFHLALADVVPTVEFCRAVCASRRAACGLRYMPMVWRTLSMNNGSRLSLNDSQRCGWRAKARQIWLIAVWFSPKTLAMERRRPVGCVAGLALQGAADDRFHV